MSKEKRKGKDRYRCDYCKKLVPKDKRPITHGGKHFCSVTHVSRYYQLSFPV